MVLGNIFRGRGWGDGFWVIFLEGGWVMVLGNIFRVGSGERLGNGLFNIFRGGKGGCWLGYF